MMWRIALLTLLALLAFILTAWFEHVAGHQAQHIERNGGDSMTIELRRGQYTWQYRQRPDEPTVLESRPIYRGSPWRFWARYADAEQARAALLAMEERGREEEHK